MKIIANSFIFAITVSFFIAVVVMYAFGVLFFLKFVQIQLALINAPEFIILMVMMFLFVFACVFLVAILVNFLQKMG